MERQQAQGNELQAHARDRGGLKQEIDALLTAAEKTDAEEDAQYGKDRHGDELPVELQRRASRLQKIGQGKAALEQEAKEKAAQQRAEAEQKLAERHDDPRSVLTFLKRTRPRYTDMQRPGSFAHSPSPG